MTMGMRMSGMKTITQHIMKSELKQTCILINIKDLFRNECLDICPENSHCEWSFCECNADYTKSWGQCSSSTTPSLSSSRTSLNPAVLPCSDTSGCRTVDINMVCQDNTCSCRRDMKWNPKALECQVRLAFKI